MKRILLLVTLGLFFFLHAPAQLRVAIVGGGHQSKILEENDLPGWEEMKNNYKGRTGVHLGFLADLAFGEKSNFYFQPGIIYHNKGRKYSEFMDTSVSNIFSVNATEYINYIDMPLNLVYKIRLGGKTKFMIGAGPYVSFFYTGKLKTETLTKEFAYTLEENNDPGIGDGPDKYSTLDYGLNGLAGFEFGRVFLTANFSQGMKDIFQPANYTASKYRNQVIGATLGIFLGKAEKLEPKDKDKDGVPDTQDQCPDVAGLPALLGCPDSDLDGLADADDQCPTVAGPKDNKGCPYPDSDKDGLLDKDDKCPDTAGPVENGGCPYPDTDGDGILDKDDQCPEKIGLARYEGCPAPDTDGDSIPDEQDKCPAIPGTIANNGCPDEIKEEIVKKVERAAQRIQFKVNSAVLTPASYKVLDEVVSILNNEPGIRVNIGGHTSSEGGYELNKRISNERANTVRVYLESKGIDPSRLTAMGYGPDKPLVEEKTPADRAKNRRVELELSNQ